MPACLFAAVLACGVAEAQLVVDVNEVGGLDRVTLGGTIVAQDVRMQIVKPRWQGNLGVQAPGGDLALEQLAPEDPRSAVGIFPCEGMPCKLEVWLVRGSPEDDYYQMRFRLTPTADLETELVVVMVDFPVAGNAGQGEFLICDGERIQSTPLPAELPDPYHIASSPDMAWCGWLLPGDVGLRVEPDGQGIVGVSLQDNRQFGGDVFEAQFPVRDTHGLRAGRSYDFGLTLRPLSRAAVAQERAALAALYKPLEDAMVSRKPLALRGVQLSAPQVAAYEKLELVLDLDATFDNPFDPDDVDVMATFSGPGGRVMRVPGFFMQAYEWVERAGQKSLRSVGDPGWHVRFAPPEPGTWQVVVAARDRTGQVTWGPVAFECTPGSGPGMVRRVPDNPYYLQFDNGQPYFAVGENICWAGGNGTEQYAEWFAALGAAGGNYCRIWLVRWNMALEWLPGKGSGHYLGLGKYSQDNAARLDWVMEQARKYGIYCMLCLGYHGELMDTQGYFHEDCWGENPYNAANGGPCEKPADFWVNEQARKLYKQRLRYYIARYGWDSHVLSWEFWNEVQAPAPWIAEMAQYVKGHDPYQHLVTTTYGYDEVWRVPEVDYTQAHTYGSDEDRPHTAAAIASLGREYTTRWPKPFMIGEFGIDWKSSDSRHDPAGIGTSLHDGLWASIMTRCFGVAAVWYWDDYVHAKGMYREFTPVRKFVDSVPWPKLKLELADFAEPTVPTVAGAPWGDVEVRPSLGWARNTGSDFTVNPNGTLSGEGGFSDFLFSDSKKDLKAPLRFHVTYPSEGAFRFHVDTVSASGHLHVRVDGVEVWQRQFPTGRPGEGEWKDSRFYEQWGIWQSSYDTDCEVTIPAGQHVIEIENTGADWVHVTRYVFAGCKDPRYATLDQYGLRTDDFAVFWLHDQESNWYNDKYGKAPREIAGAQTALLGLRDGTYHIEWWDTRKGEVVGTTQAVCEGGRLPLVVPTFLRDVAGKAARVL